MTKSIKDKVNSETRSIAFFFSSIMQVSRKTPKMSLLSRNFKTQSKPISPPLCPWRHSDAVAPVTYLPTAREMSVAAWRIARTLPALRSRSRAFASAAARHKGTHVGDLLAAAAAANPLKDAVRFADTGATWTYHDLSTHVDALAAGLDELGYVANDKIVVAVPPGCPEYAVTMLAAAKLGVTVVACDAPVDSVEGVASALRAHRPKMLIVSHESQLEGAVDSAAGVVSKNAVIDAIAPGVAAADARGLQGFSSLTGRPFQSADHPYLQHVTHTGDMHVRGASTFKSLLVYRGAFPGKKATADAPFLILSEKGEGLSQKELIANAEALGAKLQLSGNHGSKNGALVIPPSTSAKSAAAITSTVMFETMWLSPGSDASAAFTENALMLD